MDQQRYVEWNDKSLPMADARALDDDELDAHRQVLGMASAIEQLTQDFARQQVELAAAYKRLQQYTLQEESGDSPKVRQSVRPGNRRESENCSCSHVAELEEMTKLLEVKDLALTEALQQRNEHRVELGRAEALIAELRALHLDSTGGRVPRAAWKVYPPPSPGTSPSAGITRSTRNAASAVTAIQYSMANVGIRTPLTQSASSALLGCPGAIDVPHDERFDVESTYKQRKQTGDTFWRQQYKEAVRMRKSPGQQGVVTTQYNSGGIGTPQPSLKIFSCPDNRKKINQIRDESVPFSRYIGISSKQNEIIKEQHRMLEKE